MSVPLGSRPRVLLTSVFGPFARDDEFGSRAINPLELYHNQVTRAQGPFSLRMHHRSWGIMLIQENISARSTLLDFPTRERFIEELTANAYDVVGISGIIVNIGKVREMCRLVRLHSPKSVIVVGGHVAAIPGVERMLDADHVVKGEGIRWFREFLGDPVDAPIAHPAIPSSFGFRLMGLKAPRGGGDPAATIIPSVGCPMGCNFCTTSSFFGGKGHFVNFFHTGKELFDIMCEVERKLEERTFFMMDENFLLYKKRALDLLDHMKREGKAWSMFVFSSANAIRQYDMRQLVELGVSWVWMGFESPSSGYVKLKDTDTIALTRELQSHGIRVQGSTIVGMEHHTPENMRSQIEHAVAHDADCHQFMLYTPVPGTPLHADMEAQGRMLNDIDLADIHGQYKFNFKHEHIERDDSKSWLDLAFQRDFDANGPSLLRMMRTIFEGWRRYRQDGDARVRARFKAEASKLREGYGAALWAMERYLRHSNAPISARARVLRLEIERELGGLSWAIDRLVGPVLLWSARREAAAFPAGRPLEPQTFVDRRNW
ncbi:MAG: cobalamin-dependent protein [Xanthobacteraceae bacterium]|nr:cobalamin-dependent protein [Xanthobacteraceae bacterium]